MSNIHLLKNTVYELIAAGEFITKPSYLVKELVENSIDAKSSHISVEIKNGGKSLIRVIDNGIGIKNKECRLAFLAHATSKIFEKEDLEKIETLGFRGEALASICAVSSVKMITKHKEETLGTRYIIEYSKEKIYEQIEACNGTTIEVRDLFKNLPARLKFLKKDIAEAAAIQDILEKLALSSSNVSFEFKKDGKKVFQTFSSLEIKDIIYNIFGLEFLHSLMEIQYKNQYFCIKGFVSKPSNLKSYRSVEYIFVNSRCVKSKICVDAVEEAFRGYKMTGKFPYFILYITVAAENLDVNIHPNKTKIRFLKEEEIKMAICYAVKEAIFKENNSFIFKKTLYNNHTFESEENFNFKTNKNIYESKKVKSILENFEYLSTANIIKKKPSKIKQQITEEQKNMIDSIVLEDNKPIEKDIQKNIQFNVNKLKIIGELFKLYILAEIEDNFVIIDKHAAHERIIYENLKKDSKENIKRQILVSPIKVVVKSNEDYSVVFENLDLFIKFGFLAEPFEGHLILLREIPMILKEKDCSEVFLQILNNIKLNKTNLLPEKLDEIYSQIACKAAIKANDVNDIFELEKLANKVYFNMNIRNCPHGRPVVLVFNKQGVNKKFGR